MRSAPFLFSLIFVTTASGSGILMRDWQEWKAKYNKSYCVDEEVERLGIWRKNTRIVAYHNAEADEGLHQYKMELNSFADMGESISQLHPRLVSRSPCNQSLLMTYTINLLSDSIDWRKQGAVTPVQNQGSLGKSWTFSATGALEAQNFKKNGRLIKLSEENLADCATEEFSPYCAVGSPTCAFYYVEENGGIDTRESYPSLHDGQCHYDPMAIGGKCSGCCAIPPGDETVLTNVVASVGPVSAVIDAGRPSFQMYSSGIYDDPYCRGDTLNHAVLIVGYGTEEGKDYWIVKNSWGASWGESGYIRIARNEHNLCGIASEASYPVV